MEVLLSEVEARKTVLFGTLSSGMSSKRKRSVCEAVNAVGSEKRTQAEVKKKWSDIKVDVKRRLAAHRRSVAKTESGYFTLYAWGYLHLHTETIRGLLERY